MGICEQKARVFTSIYDEKTVDFAEELNNPIYKVAAFEITLQNL